jgi:hypothetical protein
MTADITPAKVSVHNPQFSGRRIDQEFELLHALSEFIENGDAAVEYRATIDRRLDPSRATVEEAQSNRVLDIRYRLGNGGLRNGKIGGRLSHAAGFRGGEQDMQVAQRVRLGLLM